MEKDQKVKPRWTAVVGFIILLAVTILAAAAVINGIVIFFQAEATLTPQNIVVSNQTSGSLTVSFSTANNSAQAIIDYGNSADDLSKKSFDADAFTEGSTLHYLVLDNLPANSTVYYVIFVNGVKFTNNNIPYQTKTFKIPPTPELPESLTGTLSPTTTNCIIYSHLIQGSATSTSQTTLSSSNGTFILDLNAFKNKTSEEKFVASAETKLLVMAICPDKSRAGYMGSVTTDVGTLPLSQNFPVAEYSTTLTSLPGVTQATITPTTFISPTATATLIPVSPTIRQSITPISSGTVSPTPAVVLP